MTNLEDLLLDKAARAAQYEKGNLEARDIVALLGFFMVHNDGSPGALASFRKLEGAMPKTTAVMKEWLLTES